MTTLTAISFKLKTLGPLLLGLFINVAVMTIFYLTLPTNTLQQLQLKLIYVLMTFVTIIEDHLGEILIF